jgi:hypothetical protein
VTDGAIAELLARIADTPRCTVAAPAGTPDLGSGLVLPADLRDFYSRCGGVTLFSGAPFSLVVSSPSDLMNANQVILGRSFPDDRSDSWFVIARAGAGERISIDLHPSRAGNCYDSFHEVHAVAGSCAIVARSFTELLTRLMGPEGDHWYWLEPGFEPLGDAYDVAE